MRIFPKLLLLVSLMFSSVAWSFDTFTIKEIRVEGLQRIALGTVLNYLPVKEGDKFTDARAAQSIEALFGTGFFNDIKLVRDAQILVVKLEERPSIAKISIEGNEEISSEDLTDSLKKIGLAEGRVFNRSLLERVEQELQRQYFSQGRYGVSIESKILEQERNRVAIDVKIDEGEVARIRKINIIGNDSFSDELLLDKLNSGEHNFMAQISGSSNYSREKLQADLEIIRSYYMDRGYINFNIESTQVSISPDKRDVFVTVNVSEGQKFFVKDISLRGELIVGESELRKVLKLEAGEIFSRKAISESSNAISERLSEEGYAFANVNPSPEFDKKEGDQVSLVFFVDPGKRVFVRRVNFTGNVKTQDIVLRREMRQLEGGWISTSKINRSKVRLQRTGFFQEINVETPPVPGHTDIVDVNFSVVEQPSGNVQASVGYGGESGFIIAGSINQNNFLGTGRRVGLEVNNSEISRVYSFSVSDPYYTVDGVSRSFSLFSRRTEISNISAVGAYVSDVAGGSASLGIPLSEYRSARLALSAERTNIHDSASTPTEFLDYLDVNGRLYNTLSVTGTWSYDTRNHILFADSGTYISASAEVSLPFTDTSLYKLNYRHQWFIPMFIDGWTLRMEGMMSYGDGYNNTKYPFFENYFAGGGQSVRGYAERSLGPKAENTSISIGGNRRFTGTSELVFPSPFASEDSRSTRFSFFVDGGYVYGPDDELDPLQLRVSYGASFIWITPMGALRFSYALPVVERAGDILQRFQFSIGAPY